jgi:hypothetical protein
MTTTPTSLGEFIGPFEKIDFDPAKAFYYELSTNTINFGYGNNLTGVTVTVH